MFNYILSNKDLKLYFGNGICKSIDYRSQHSYDIYDKFKVDLYKNNECNIEFKENVELNFDGFNLFVHYDEKIEGINSKIDNIVNLFDDITNLIK